eukprot:CAMPEP_0170568226 /NCGR_PEP_ID=MMETSP0211-20121228/81024_1 /TAXON_ID=311385 /ORGANISM="Pseudokeronopsis sp., Strain OXSARD2" /LENGTH=70 /DNA_ID=CAMNT_0010889985 /DNA_START=3568 /DNA_END=3780 /DNA_ORIENTATION=+
MIAPLNVGVNEIESSISEVLKRHDLGEDDEEISDLESDKENPAALLNSKNNYVMVANNSKLARKGYYKAL